MPAHPLSPQTHLMKLNLINILLCSALLAAAQTGPAVPELAPLDRTISNILTKYQIPGVAVSIAKDGRLVYTRGFGVADVVTKEPVQPDSLFRIASVSKPITAMAVLKLIEEGKLTLDTKYLAFVGRPNAAADPRYADITVRHLLQHTAGLDITFWEFDPSFPDRTTLEALGVDLPPTRKNVLDFTFANLPLAFAPGTKDAYSNIGYMMLSEVIEKAAGQPYEAYMREKILAPMGIERMRIAGSLLTERQPGEVRYWDKDRVDAPIFPGLPAQVPVPYGPFNIRIFESGGGWLASMPDLVRFLSAFDAGSTYSLLRPETLRLINERPSFVPATQASYSGLGWQVTTTPLGTRWDHDGALPGTSAWFFRGINGVSFAIAANHLPDDELLEQFYTELQLSLSETLLAVPRWPTNNTFETYFPGQAPRISHAGVINAASQRPGPVAAGSAVTLFGLNLANGTVRVNGSTADTLWSGPNQLTVRVPLSANGPTNFQVDRNGRTSNVETVLVQSAAPALFTASRNGYGQAAALNQNGSINSTRQPAAPGSIVVVYATGATIPPVITVGARPAEVLFSGPAPGLPLGVQQINLRLPSDLPSGDALVNLGASGEATIAVR